MDTPNTAYVFASGPSLKDILLEDWDGKLTIGINGVGLLISNLSIWCAVDLMPEPIVQWANNFCGYKFCSVINQHQFNKAVVIKQWAIHGPLPWEQAEVHGFYWHGSTAMLACEIVRLLFKAKRIIIFGLDYNDTTHVYDKLSPKLARTKKFWDMELLERNWRNFYLSYQKYNIELYNANNNSALQAVPKLINWKNVPEKVKGAI